MSPRDPGPIPVRTEAMPWRAPATSFDDLVAEQLRHAPWMALSIVLHVLVFALLLLFMPPQRREPAAAAVNVQLDEPPQVVPPEPPPPPVPVPEDPTPTDPQLVDPSLDVAPDTVADDAVSAESPSLESAFDRDQWNVAIGVNGGASGHYARRGRRGPGGGGGDGLREATNARALKWLARHQDDDGRWDADGFMKHDVDGAPCTGPGNGVHDVGVTGLALLAFLGDGSTLRSGEYRENLRRGAKWLRDQQRDDGLFGSNTSSDFVYDHAIAAYAICEAYGLSQATLLHKTAQGGIDYLQRHRNPYGAWRYQPRDNDNDMSVTGWCIMACESGKYFGLEVDDRALKTAATWIESVTDPSGRTGYARAGQPSSRHPGEHLTRFPVEKGEAMTAVALFCRYFLKQDPRENQVMAAAAEVIARRPPVWDDAGGVDHYYWYYGTYALFQVGGPLWRDWSKRIDAAVITHQRRDGNFDGSWDPVGVWGEDGGRVYSTAMLALVMQAYYRYSRILR